MTKKFSLSQLLKEQAPNYEAPELKGLGELFLEVELKGYWKRKFVQSGFFKDEREASHYDEAAQSLQIRPDLSHFDQEARKELESWHLDGDKLAKVLEIKKKIDDLDYLEAEGLDGVFKIFKEFYQKELGVKPGELEFFMKECAGGLNERYIETAVNRATEQGLDPHSPEGKKFLAREFEVYGLDTKKPTGDVTEFNPKSRK